MKDLMEYTLKVGQSTPTSPGIFTPSIAVIYAGMASESVYSLVVRWAQGNNSLAYNLFFSDRQLEVYLPKGKIKIINVSRDHLLFKYLKKEPV